jgi:NitT/TauT family transport system substrate-binding protein
MKVRKKWLAFTLIAVLLLGIAGCSVQETEDANQAPSTNSGEKSNLVVGSAPGPVCYGLAYMAENPADDFALQLEPWNKYDQLLAMITSDQVNISSAPLTNAIMLYNKGVDVKLMNVVVWGMLYVLSPEDTVQNITDLKGKQIAVNSQGSNHDLVLRHLLINNGLDPDKDVDIIYLELSEASAKLASGELKYAVLNEPNSSMATLNARKGGVELKRVLDLQKEWQKLTGQETARIPQAGFVVVNSSQLNKDVVEKFQQNLTAAVKWVNDNPEEAGPLVEKHFDWMKGPAVQQSLQFARLELVPAADCREEIEAFYKELSKTAPAEALGGKLPGADFYFQP